jgi:hypothetical protein
MIDKKMSSTCNIINADLFQKCKNFVQHALTFLESKIGINIIDFIENKPETERNHFYRLLNPSLNFIH